MALAHLLGEGRHPPDDLWEQPLVSSRLLEYELFVRLHARRLGRGHLDAAYRLVDRLAILELTPPVLARALEPFPLALRTLDALHLASLAFLRAQGAQVALATYDQRMLEAAEMLQLPIALVG